MYGANRNVPCDVSLDKIMKHILSPQAPQNFFYKNEPPPYHSPFRCSDNTWDSEKSLNLIFKSLNIEKNIIWNSPRRDENTRMFLMSMKRENEFEIDMFHRPSKFPISFRVRCFPFIWTTYSINIIDRGNLHSFTLSKSKSSLHLTGFEKRKGDWIGEGKRGEGTTEDERVGEIVKAGREDRESSVVLMIWDRQSGDKGRKGARTWVGVTDGAGLEVGGACRVTVSIG